MSGGGAIVANHTSWLDVPVLFGTIGGYMVAKDEVSRWPVIGQFASALGTEYVDRKRTSSRAQVGGLQARLKADDRLIFFPEGTSTDGLQCTPFRSTLFAALVEANPEGMVQPVSIIYRAPENASVNFYGWWAGMSLGSHMLPMLGMPKRGHVDVVFHEPIVIGCDRKALCKAAQAAVEAGFTEFLKIR
jgi:1-acyl-sn-glycerol-3-phosphate acyltransferase